MIQKNNDAFVEKLSSVHDFKSFYSQANCLTEAAILEMNSKKTEKYALVRVFVNLNIIEQSYIIFINNKEKVVFIDFVSGESLDAISKEHLNFSPEQSIYMSGVIQIIDGKIILDNKSFLAAALLWSVNQEANLDPKNGLEEVKKTLNPLF